MSSLLARRSTCMSSIISFPLSLSPLSSLSSAPLFRRNFIKYFISINSPRPNTQLTQRRFLHRSIGMEGLWDGYQRFRSTYWQQHQDVFQALANGQRPRCMVISCCDSRVDPALIFDASPGEIFCVRNVANLVPPYKPNHDYHGTSAALEFAVVHLKVEHIIVMGHSRCGGIAALMRGVGDMDSDFIGSWMKIAQNAKLHVLTHMTKIPEDKQLSEQQQQQHLAFQAEMVEQEAIRLSHSNMLTFPWIKSRVDEGKLKLHCLYFKVQSGEIINLMSSSQ